jgi:hypothetical protein
MKIEWKKGTYLNPKQGTDYFVLYINGMQVGYISPFGEGVRGVVAPKLREAMQGPPVLIIHKTIEEAKAELEGVCVAILIGESCGT